MDCSTFDPMMSYSYKQIITGRSCLRGGGGGGGGGGGIGGGGGGG